MGINPSQIILLLHQRPDFSLDNTIDPHLDLGKSDPGALVRAWVLQ